MPLNQERPDRAPTRALARGLQILLTFAEERRPLTLSEITTALDMSPATTYRLLGTLEQYGFVHRSAHTKQFAPGLAIMSLVPLLLDSVAVSEMAQRHVQQVVEDTNETANLAVLDGDSVLYLHSIARPSMLTVNNPSGLRTSPHCSALGKVLLARVNDETARHILGPEPYDARTESTRTTWKDLRRDLELTRQRGYSITEEEYEVGLCGVAVPVDLPLDKPIALNVSCPTSRWSIARATNELVPSLQRAASAIASASGRRGGAGATG